ncbi:hypothetical protein NM208_g3665 [Fusarium decemcellulare]|uniref:Uncharacterized protein n=1 Tax=Fusarium decemcellulare TaxID=57161 RepID=A0ACC1SNK9_9HYPO|nr:hypothetical protein NM208_g3665 [Fusarium decemcellulare]
MDAMSQLDRQLRDLAEASAYASFLLEASFRTCLQHLPACGHLAYGPSRKSESHLDALFERLQNLEEKCLHLASNLSTQPRSQERQFSPASFDVESLAYVVPTSGQHTTSSPSTTSLAQTAPETDPMTGESSSSCIAKRPQHSLDASTLLKRAFDQVLGLKQQNINEWMACSDACIRQEISKACVQNFWKYYQLDIFPNFINTKLMHLIPDIIAMPEVSLDPATVVLYYGILYQGSLVASTDLTRQDKNLTQSMYICCLREMPTWLQKGSGTKVDLIAGVLLARVAAQQADFESAWNMHRLACQCVRQLNLHKIDADNLGGLMNSDRLSSEANQDRGSLWGLALADLIFRLIHDKPALLMTDLAEWQVNIPWLDVGPKPLQPHVPTLVSLAKSQLVLILLRFFDTVDREGENKVAMADRVRFLCAEVEQLFLEWAVEDLMKTQEANVSSWWALYDVMLTGYCSILFMLHKMTATQLVSSGVPIMDEDVALTSLIIKAARRVLDLACQSLKLYPHPAALCGVFGSFRCYVAYDYLARHLSRGNSQEPEHVVTSDIALLESLTQNIAAIADIDKTLLPVVFVLLEVNQAIYAAWAEQAETSF